MSYKRLRRFILISICIVYSASGMDTAGFVIKNYAAPASLIIGAGSGLAALSSCFLKKIHNLPNWQGTIKKDLIKGTLSSLSLAGAALVGSRLSRLDFSIKNCLAVVVLGLLAHGGLTMLYTKLEQGFMALERHAIQPKELNWVTSGDCYIPPSKEIVPVRRQENNDDEELQYKTEYITSALIPVSFAVAASSIGIARFCKNYVS